MPTRDAWAEALAPQLYAELKVLAHAHLRREREGHTLGTTALVHDAWLRLSSSEALPPEDASRFFAMAAATMRRVLVDHARRVHSQKRGSGSLAEPLESVEALLTTTEAEELVSLDDALERLAAIHPRAAHAVVLRFFGGLTEAEAATALEVSPKTIRRDWLAARAWLRKEVAHDLGLMPDDLEPGD
jgi:RNA polymerase sigma factor (TIGR02999 family)